jgi:UDP-N-acetyl-2-amino-2-deoxyglucuronate dehydrogenase
MLRVAIVGCGLISKQHIPAYLQNADRARITVCCDPVRERAEEAAAAVGGAKVVTDYREVLDDPDVDSIDLLTPHAHHMDGVIEAAKAGKHILCQKPLARNLEESDQMIAAAREAGATLFYGEMNRTSEVVVAAKRAIDEGRVGTLVGLQAIYSHWQGGAYLNTAWRYDPEEAGGGQLLDGGIHLLDVLLHLGGPVAGVMCHTTRFRPELGGEDTATLSLRYKGGHLGSFLATHAAGCWSPEAYCTVIGTEGVLTLGGSHGPLALHRRGQPKEVLVTKPMESFQRMIGAYLDTVVDGKPNIAPAEVGREDLAVVLAAYRSVKEGKEIAPE